MKAWHIPSFGIENLNLADLPEPIPGTGEVLVRVRAISLNYRDLMIVKGRYNPKMKLPRIPCSDGACEVLATGSGVTTFKPGDRVAGIFMQNWQDGELTQPKARGALGGDIDGMAAELVVLDENGLVNTPPHLSFEETATLPCAAVTAWNALTHASHVKSGDTVVIQGTGGVSIFALQFAKLLGARVLGTSSGDEKLARAAKMGLDAGFNYKRDPDWPRWVLDQTDGDGADLIVEVGGAGTFQQSLKAVKMGGTIAQIGVLTGTQQPLDITPILHKQIRVHGVYVGSRADFAAMNERVSDVLLKPCIGNSFAFSDLPQALRDMESGSHFGKIVVMLP